MPEGEKRGTRRDETAQTMSPHEASAGGENQPRLDTGPFKRERGGGKAKGEERGSRCKTT